MKEPTSTSRRGRREREEGKKENYVTRSISDNNTNMAK
jgi:hypothetical protein